MRIFISIKNYTIIMNKKIAILGFSFKANTNDTRESAAIRICKDLIEEGAELVIHDPKVNPLQIEIDLQIKQFSEMSNDNKYCSNNNLGKSLPNVG